MDPTKENKGINWVHNAANYILYIILVVGGARPGIAFTDTMLRYSFGLGELS